ncbi:unnamed protein product [Orchesella dallaii]|uniref:BACK domain-containing protein n=1 Tax=Orchesella dallaii TaxID=48710 RepID=A0ABP1R2X9_9HEXA
MARTRSIENQKDMALTISSPKVLSDEEPSQNDTSRTEDAESNKSETSASTNTTSSAHKTKPLSSRTLPFRKRGGGGIPLFEGPTMSRTYTAVAKPSPQEPEPLQSMEIVTEHNNDEHLRKIERNEGNFPQLETSPSSLGRKSLMDILEQANDEENSNDESMEMETDEQTQTLRQRIYQLYKSGTCNEIFDVKIFAGNDPRPVYADGLSLSLYCENLAPFFNRNEQINRSSSITYENLERRGIVGMLEFIYGGDCEVEKWERDGMDVAVRYVSSVLAAAKQCGCNELIEKCEAYFDSKLSPATAPGVFNTALKEEDEQLKEIALNYITKNIKEVFSSEGFCELSEDVLLTLLKTDNWYLDEMEVFLAVKRWAEARYDNGNMGDNPALIGEQLRVAMGPTFSGIRFGLMTVHKVMDDIHEKYPGFFTAIEVNNFLNHFFRHKQLDPPYLTRPRLENASSCPSSPSQEKKSVEVKVPVTGEGSPTVSNEADNKRLDEEVVDFTIRASAKKPVKNTTPKRDDNVSETKKDVPDQPSDDEPVIVAPPKKKRKKANTDTAVNNLAAYICQSFDEFTAKEQTLHKLVQTLHQDPDKDVPAIHQTVELTLIPSIRVQLPNLESVNLTLKMRKSFSNGTSFKSQMKTKLVNLKHILFFEKQAIQTPIESVLGSLLNQGINITLNCVDPNSTFLKVDHNEGTLVLNLLKDAQEIINSLSNFPLKKLCISECELSSLAPFRQDLLEVIVIRKSKGLKKCGEFLKACSGLKAVSWNDMGGEEINLTDILNSNKSLKKFSVAKCKLVLSDTGTINELQELYLDNCPLDREYIPNLAWLFPCLKRIQIYGKDCQSKLFWGILQMPSIEWICLWEMAFLYKKVNRKSILEEDSEKATEFLKNLFGTKYVLKDKLTFVIERISAVDENGHRNNSNVLQDQQELNIFDASNWKGEKLLGREKFQTITRLDFEQNSYNQFYADFDAYLFSESSEKDMKRKFKKQLMSTDVDTSNHNSNESHLHGVAGVSGESTVSISMAGDMPKSEC